VPTDLPAGLDLNRIHGPERLLTSAQNELAQALEQTLSFLRVILRLFQIVGHDFLSYPPRQISTVTFCFFTACAAKSPFGRISNYLAGGQNMQL
jgi:hypothetical protein